MTQSGFPAQCAACQQNCTAAAMSRGGAPHCARSYNNKHKRPALQVSAQTSWVINGFAAGYARAIDARAARNVSGVPVAEEASDGVYRVLFEGLESALALGVSTLEADEANRRYAMSSDGRTYLTSAPMLAQPVQPTKDEWWRDMPEMPRAVRHRPLLR